MKLKKNQMVFIRIEGVEGVSGEKMAPFSLSFTTILQPMLSTPNRVREVAGSYIQEISDDILNQLILKYSLEAINIASCDTTKYEKWEFYASKWVTLKVAADAIYNSSIYLGDPSGKVYKKLGDFSISKDAKDGDTGSPARAFLEKLECEIFKLDITIRFCKEPLLTCEGVDNDALYSPAPAKLVVKGQNLCQPMFGRTFLQIGNQPQWTGWIKGMNNRKHLTNYLGYE